MGLYLGGTHRRMTLLIGKRAVRRHLGLPLSVCHQGLFCIILGVSRDQRIAADLIS